ncbi:hypothetical protein [Streptomyces macrosporus]|uniref:hypothetical protein n=1 Tax=Streptomyces macrosporus TaxID=44032 RepID=UPI0031E077D9
MVLTTQGRSISPGDETLVVDDQGRPVADGETGELLARGPGVITAYHGDPDTTSFTPTASTGPATWSAATPRATSWSSDASRT